MIIKDSVNRNFEQEKIMGIIQFWKDLTFYWRGWKMLNPFSYGKKIGYLHPGLYVLGPFGFHYFPYPIIKK